jgi:hypothetical protein
MTYEDFLNSKIKLAEKEGKKLTYHVWTIREINQLKQFAVKGLNTKEAAEQLNVPHFSVKNACHKYRIKFIRRKVFKKVSTRRAVDIEKAQLTLI